MNAGALVYLGGGRISTTSALPSSRAPNAIPFDALGRLCVNVGGTIASYVSGLPYGPSGRLVTAMTNSIPIAGYVAGIAITVNGRIATDDAGAIDHYVRGIPVTAEGRVVIGPVAVVAKGLTDLDDDDNPDTVLLDTPGGGPDVTIDSDSVNVDTDGDGTADTVTPT